MKIRVFVDTNVYVSALIFGGVPDRVLSLDSAGAHEFCISAPILAEVRRILVDRFEYAPDRDQTRQRLRDQSRFIVPSESISACTDPDADMVLECAVAAQAEVIVTGDRALLRLDPFRGIRILTPAQFLADAAQNPYR